MLLHMSGLVLRRLSAEDAAAFHRALADWDHHSSFHFFGNYHAGMPFVDYLKRLQQNERGENLPSGKIADTALFGFVEGRIVGRLSLRHETM
jgi:predicted acetyltransferase